MPDRLTKTLGLIARHRPRPDDVDTFQPIGDAAARLAAKLKRTLDDATADLARCAADNRGQIERNKEFLAKHTQEHDDGPP